MERTFISITVILTFVATSSLAMTIPLETVTEDPGIGCGQQNYLQPYGNIESPNYPGSYGINMDCNYYIHAPPSGSSFALIFKHFDVENGYDFLRVSCATNSSFAVRTYTGYTIPQALSIPWCSQALLYFHSDYVITGTGFRIEYHASVGGCGNTVYAGSSGYLTSPNYPQDYSNNQNCSNIIWAPQRVPFSLSFSDLFTEEFYDYVEISCWDNSSERTYKFTGTFHIPVQYTSCSEVRVLFTSDETNTYPGFFLNYNYTADSSGNSTLSTSWPTPSPPGSSLDASSTTNSGIGCGEQIYFGSYGSIESPNYPGNYGDSMNCNYYIDSPTTDGSFVLIFKHFDVETNYDYLQVSCATNSTFEPIAYTGHQIPDPLSIPGCSQALLYFHTDGSVTYTGFRIEYHASQEDCGNTLFTGSTGYLTSPNYPQNYGNNQNCSNIIWAPQPVPFYLNFSDFNLGALNDYVEISCWDNPEESTYRFTGTNHFPVQYTNCSEVGVFFSSDSSTTLRGFYMNYYYPDEYSGNSTSSTSSPWPSSPEQSTPDSGIGCGEQIYLGPYGIIESPNYPGNYGNSRDCNYYIQAPSPDGSFVLIFKHFDLETNYDYLRVSCASNSTFAPITYTGHQIPAPLAIPLCSEALLYFHTDGSVTYTGFEIEYHASDEGCGNTLFSGSTGYLTSPNYPDPYGNNQNCSNIIWAPQPVPFYLNFSDFYLEALYDSIEISCLDNPEETTYRFTGTYSFPIQYTNCSEVSVFFSSDSSIALRGFYMNYYYPDEHFGNSTSSTSSPWPSSPELSTPDSDIACGKQNYAGSFGSIESPNYPGYYDNSLSCNYFIHAPSSDGSFALIFKYFDVEYGYDYLQVSCATNSSFEPRTYTGYAIPEALSIPWCSQALLYFYSDFIVPRTGFRIEYHVSQGGCGNTVLKGSSGYLTSPNYPQDYSDNQNCYSIIWAPESVPFYLNFSDFYTEKDYDYVEISCWDNSVEATYSFTGTYTFPIQYTNCSEVRVFFASDSTITTRGFYLNYNYPGDYSVNSTEAAQPEIKKRVGN